MWKEEIVPLVGEIYGVPEAAEEALGDYGARIESLRSELGDPGEIVVSIVSVFADSISLSGTISPSGLVLGDIGFARPEPQNFELTGEDLSSLPISEERILDMDGDEIFIPPRYFDSVVLPRPLCGGRRPRRHRGGASLMDGRRWVLKSEARNFFLCAAGEDPEPQAPRATDTPPGCRGRGG